MSNYVTNARGLNDPKQLKNHRYKVNWWCNTLLLKTKKRIKMRANSRPGETYPYMIYDRGRFVVQFLVQFPSLFSNVLHLIFFVLCHFQMWTPSCSLCQTRVGNCGIVLCVERSARENTLWGIMCRVYTCQARVILVNSARKCTRLETVYRIICPHIIKVLRCIHWINISAVWQKAMYSVL